LVKNKYNIRTVNNLCLLTVLPEIFTPQKTRDLAAQNVKEPGLRPQTKPVKLLCRKFVTLKQMYDAKAGDSRLGLLLWVR